MNNQHHQHPSYVPPPHPQYSQKVEEFLKQHHVEFEDAGPMQQNATLQAMHPLGHPNTHSSAEVAQELQQALSNHGQMQTTLHQTEAKYAELNDLSEADAGGQEDM